MTSAAGPGWGRRRSSDVLGSAHLRSHQLSVTHLLYRFPSNALRLVGATLLHGAAKLMPASLFHGDLQFR